MSIVILGNINANKPVFASDNNQYTITVEYNTGGKVYIGETLIENTITANQGDTKKLEFISDIGYEISNIIIDSISVSPNHSYTFTNIESNHHVKIVFSKTTFKVSTMTNENGRITRTMLDNNSARFDFVPDVGYELTSLRINNVEVDLVDSIVLNNLDTYQTISATFSIKKLNVIFNITNGKISNAEATSTVEYGDGISFTIDPSQGYEANFININGEKFIINNTTLYLDNITKDTRIDIQCTPIPIGFNNLPLPWLIVILSLAVVFVVTVIILIITFVKRNQNKKSLESNSVSMTGMFDHF